MGYKAIKKIFIASVVMLLVVLVFWGVYNFAFQGNKEDIFFSDSNSSGEAVKNEEDKEKSEKEAIFSLTDKKVLSPTFTEDGKKIKYYSKEERGMYEVSFDGSIETEISEEDFSALEKIIWSPDGKKAIIELEDGYYFYNPASSETKKAKDSADNMIWSNLGDKIIYKYYDQLSGERSLNISKPDGTGWEKIADIDTKDILISTIPQTFFVSFWNYPKASEESVLRRVNIAGEGMEEIFKGKFGADYLWSPNGEKTLVSYAENGNMKLSVMNNKGENLTDLNMPTIASKCVWVNNNKEIYCALPSGILEGAIMPDDYLSGKFLTKDTFWRIDIESGEKERVVDLEEINGSYDAQNLFLSPLSNMLFFVNKYDDKLYGMNL